MVGHVFLADDLDLFGYAHRPAGVVAANDDDSVTSLDPLARVVLPALRFALYGSVFEGEWSVVVFRLPQQQPSRVVVVVVVETDVDPSLLRR